MTVASSANTSATARKISSSWIDGAPVETSGPIHTVVNPATGAATAELALATPADVDAAVAAARAAFTG
ncbi:MAG: gamma-aminobutyraldehyde dehydrogenase, partial [Mycobacterium sp.]